MHTANLMPNCRVKSKPGVPPSVAQKIKEKKKKCRRKKSIVQEAALLFFKLRIFHGKP